MGRGKTAVHSLWMDTSPYEMFTSSKQFMEPSANVSQQPQELSSCFWNRCPKNTCTLESLCKLDRRSHCTLLLLLPGERCVDTHSNVLLHWPASSLSCDGRNILQHMHHCDLCVHLSDEDIEVPPPRPKRKPHRLPSVLSTQFVTHMPAGRSSAGCGHCADHAWCSLTGGPWVLTLSTQSEYVSILPTLPCFHHADGEGRRMPRP